MKRRTFLKLLGLTPAVAVAAKLPELKQIEPPKAATPKIITPKPRQNLPVPELKGFVRKVRAYELTMDRYIYRYDITDGDTTCHICIAPENDELAIKKLKEMRIRNGMGVLQKPAMVEIIGGECCYI